MYNLELARVIYREREREVEHRLRVRAFQRGQTDGDPDAFVPPPARPSRIAQAFRLIPSADRGR
jgi:hypothetical protein